MKFSDAKTQEYVAPAPAPYTEYHAKTIEIDRKRILVFKCTPPLNQFTGEPLWEEEPFARLALVESQGAKTYAKQHIAYNTEVRYETPIILNQTLVLPTKRYQSMYEFKQKTYYQFHSESFGELLKNIEAILPKTEAVTF